MMFLNSFFSSDNRNPTIGGNESVMDYVRARIYATFFRGDILGQAARVKTKARRELLQKEADGISGVELEEEDKQLKQRTSR